MKQKAVFTVLVVTLATALFVGSSLVPRNGNALTNGDPSQGMSTHRDVRGMPLVFLKRSIGDGQCDVKDLGQGKCDPDLGNEPHEVVAVPLAIDVIFWTLLATIPAMLLVRSLPRR
jgi:hypothetical protein